jgi:hypothetical protein
LKILLTLDPTLAVAANPPHTFYTHAPQWYMARFDRHMRHIHCPRQNAKAEAARRFANIIATAAK